MTRNLMLISTLAFLSGTVAIASTACTESKAPDSEPVGVAVSALGETGCETSDKNETDAWGTLSIAGGDDYGTIDGHLTCPHQWLVGWDATSCPAGQAAHVFWEDTAPTSTTCSTAFLTLGAYSQTSGVWATPKVATYQGSWTGTVCNFVYVSGDGDPLILNGLEKNRTAVAAYYCSGSGCSTKTYQKVGVSTDSACSCNSDCDCSSSPGICLAASHVCGAPACTFSSDCLTLGGGQSGEECVSDGSCSTPGYCTNVNCDPHHCGGCNLDCTGTSPAEIGCVAEQEAPECQLLTPTDCAAKGAPWKNVGCP